MKTGKVKFFNESRGFGFIIDEETKEEIFVHVTEIKNAKSLNEDDNVTFDVKDGKRGINATGVMVV